VKHVFDVPDRGDIVLMSFAPGSGPKRAGRRPAVVLSPQAYNARVGLALVCPVITVVKGYPFEVPIPPGLPVQGAILADQAVSFDWRAHRAERVCSLPASAVEEVLGKLRSLLA
jgi:mRNA interferase MazF